MSTPADRMWSDWFELPQGDRQRRERQSGGEANAAFDLQQERTDRDGWDRELRGETHTRRR